MLVLEIAFNSWTKTTTDKMADIRHPLKTLVKEQKIKKADTSSSTCACEMCLLL